MDGYKLTMNLKEVLTTQEATQRAMSEIKAREGYTAQLLNATNDLIYTVDKEFKLITWNTPFRRASELIGVQVKKGMNAFEWWPDKRKEYVVLYKRAFNGETFEFTSQHELNGKTYHFLSTFTPLKSEADEIFEVAVFSKDTTVMTEAQIHTAELLGIITKQAELLKAREEELRKSSENPQRAVDELLWKLKNNGRIYSANLHNSF